MTQDLWNDLHTTLMAHMKTISLRSLAADQKAKGFKVAERKVSSKGILAKLKPEPLNSRVPNSVFALGQI
jgi:Rrf2 family iron-sulfur cluster assembly transcriptional regulator